MKTASRFRLALVTTLASCALVFAGCGDDDNDNDDEPDVVDDGGMGGDADAGMDDADSGMDDADTGSPDVDPDTDPDVDPDTDPDVDPGNTLADVAANAGRFETLLAAVEAANLGGLVSTQELTVFAPNDTAFQPLVDDGTIDTLLAEDPPDTLTGILSLHVLSGTTLAADLPVGEAFVDTFGGARVLVTNDGEGNVTYGGANVIATDITADNGVIHELDAVVLANETIPYIAANADGGTFDTLVAAITAAELAATLTGDGPFTVFAPTNAAFEALPEGALDNLLGDIDALTQVLLYHVVAQEIGSGDIAAGDTTVTTLAEADVTVNNTDGTITVGGATVVAPDIQASNGVIHGIDMVLMPPADTGNLVDELVADGRFTTLIEFAGTVPGLVDLLTAEGENTLFAPTDAAFAALDADTVAALEADVDLLASVLQYHAVLGDTLNSTEVLASSLITMANGIDAKVDADAGTIAGATIAETDIEATNGIIHVLDDVMTVPGTIADIATGDSMFDELVAALTAAELVAAVADEEAELTVFAPTNDAFTAIAAVTAELDVAVLTRILLSHVVEGRFDAAAVLAADSLTALSGATLAIDAEAGTIGGATIAATDIPASNGLVHVLSDVIVPADIPTVATDAGLFGTLLTAIEAAELGAALALPEGPFTVFAPTDAAFQPLVDDGTVATLLAEDPPTQLTNILLYHVVPGVFESGDVLAESLLPTLNGTFLKVDADALTVGGAALNIDNLDIFASNGVVHVVDAVIIPPGNIPEVAEAAGIFGTLLTAIEAAELGATLAGDGPFTVFAPSDTAFQPLVDDGTVATLLAEDPPATLTDILLYHVYTEGAVDAETAISLAGTSIVMANGDEAALVLTDDGLTIDGALISTTDIPASNGLIHIIDAVILPPEDL